jgi:hypothetical protein
VINSEKAREKKRKTNKKETQDLPILRMWRGSGRGRGVVKGDRSGSKLCTHTVS